VAGGAWGELAAGSGFGRGGLVQAIPSGAWLGPRLLLCIAFFGFDRACSLLLRASVFTPELSGPKTILSKLCPQKGGEGFGARRRGLESGPDHESFYLACMGMMSTALVGHPVISEVNMNNMKVTCLRCNTEIEEYLFTRLNFLPYGVGHAHVMLECDKCGHVEFLSRTSPLLEKLEATPTFAGDGD
jgi:hypothetical protein